MIKENLMLSNWLCYRLEEFKHDDAVDDPEAVAAMVNM